MIFLGILGIIAVIAAVLFAYFAGLELYNIDFYNWIETFEGIIMFFVGLGIAIFLVLLCVAFILNTIKMEKKVQRSEQKMEIIALSYNELVQTVNELNETLKKPATPVVSAPVAPTQTVVTSEPVVTRTVNAEGKPVTRTTVKKTTTTTVKKPATSTATKKPATTTVKKTTAKK